MMTPLSEGLVARARTLAESIMDDACTIVERTRGELDEDTGQYPDVDVRVYPPILDPDDDEEPTSAPCRLKNRSMITEVDAQLQLLAKGSYILSLPVAAALDIEKNLVVIMTASKYDTDVIGREFRIEGPAHQTHATARRLLVEEIS